MLKQSSRRMKQVLAIFMAVLFGVSLTAVAVSAEPVMVKEKKMVVNSETDKKMDTKNMDMKNMEMKKDMKEHGNEKNEHEEHGHEKNRHEGHGNEKNGHKEHGYGY